MNPITHFLISWNTAALAGAAKRDRMLITLGGLLPDIDALGIIVDVVSPSEDAWRYYHEYHHQLTHNITTAVVGSIAVLLMAKKKLFTALVFFGVFNLHLLCDLVGARGPRAGDIWTVPYLVPFSSMNLSWQDQWPLNGWQNFAITIIMFVVVFIIAWKKGFSPLELFSAKADKLFVQTVNKYKHKL